MSCCEEIGGYFNLELHSGSLYHQGLVGLNSGRNALRYILRTHHVKHLYVPRYTCPVVWDAIVQEGCEAVFYDIDERMLPVQELKSDSYILYTNYFGVSSVNVEKLSAIFPHLIIDNAQAFYYPAGRELSFYSPRKFFGLPDGGFANCGNNRLEDLKRDVSFSRCSHLLGRLEGTASDFYDKFRINDASLDYEEIKEMSRLTDSLCRSLPYKFARERRLENFSVLHDHFKEINEWSFDLGEHDVPLVYPLVMKCRGLREYLVSQKIYVASYWPRIEEIVSSGAFEMYLRNNLLPLPLDQRYSSSDMARIIEEISKYKNNE